MGRESAKIHILGNTSGKYRLKFLMHHGNTHLHGFIRVIDDHFFPVDKDLTGIHLVNTEKTLHQS